MHKVERLEIGQVAFQNFGADVHIYGSDDPKEPRIAITACVHGDEHAGLFIVDQLKRKLVALDSHNLLRGTVCILPSANAAALLNNQRVSDFDFKDLNRVGRGDENGSYTERNGNALFNYLKEFDLVINLHEFEMKTPVTAVLMGAGSSDVINQTLKAISAFNPEMIWVINNSSFLDRSYSLTLDTALANYGVANFPIEVTQSAFLSRQCLERTVKGILNVLASLNIIDSFQMPQLIKCADFAFTRREITSKTSGIWKPSSHLSVLSPVEEGEEIGILTTFPNFEDIPIQADHAGMLIQYRHQQIVGTGTSLFSVGHSAKHLINELIGITSDEVEPVRQLV